MRATISAFLFCLAFASPATAQITTWCINLKAAEIVALGLQVSDIPVAARMIAEDLCLHTAQEAIDLARADTSSGEFETQRLAIEHLTKLARQALLRKMGLLD